MHRPRLSSFLRATRASRTICVATGLAAALVALRPVTALVADDGDHGRGVATASDVARLRVSRLECLVGNNKSVESEFGRHKAGYNGVFWMRSPDQPETPFVPTFAGLNLEHFFDARGHYEGHSFFAPRWAPMQLKHLSDVSVELHQRRTGAFDVESWTRMSVAEPYYLDFDFRFVIHDDDFKSPFMGVFWASYINGPQDKSMYFLDAASTLDQPLWRQFCTQQHNRDSSVSSKNERLDLNFEKPGETLFSSASPLRYGEAFFYGRFRNMVLIYIFQPNDNLRLTHSPSGGGTAASGDDTSPAWDFHLIVPRYEVGKDYRLSARVVYKPWVDRDDVIAEVRKYRDHRP